MSDIYEGTESKAIEDISEFFRKSMPEVFELRPTSTLVVPVMDNILMEIYVVFAHSFIDMCKSACVNLLQEKHGKNASSMYSNLKIKLVQNKFIRMSEIDSQHVNSPIAFNCMVLGVDKVQMYIKQSAQVCYNCNIKDMIDGEIPIRCNNCTKEMTIVKEDSIWEKYQTAILQEPLEEARNSSPVEHDAILTGDLVGDSFVGQRKRVSAILQLVQVKKGQAAHDIVLKAISIDDIDDVKLTMPTEEDLTRFREMAKKDDYFNFLVDSLAPDIFGYRDVKLSVLLSLVGGISTNNKQRKTSNLLLLGDPSTAKSSLLKACELITDKSIFTSGRGSSAAGLTIGIVKRSNGTSFAQAGALPLSHNGYCFIDEFDKMSPNDRSAMHEAMEQQTVSIAKAGIKLQLPAKTTIIAAANPKSGKWESELTIADNVNLTPTLLSRFDMKWRILDKVDAGKDQQISSHILDQFDEETEATYTTDDLKKIINVARKNNTKLTKKGEAYTKLVESYTKIRGYTKDKGITLDVRTLEGLFRLSAARAKLRFSEEIEVEDVDAILDLYRKSLDSFDVSIVEGMSQQTMSGGSVNQEQSFWLAFEKLKDMEETVDPAELVRELSASKHFDEVSARRYFDKLHRFGYLLMGADGRYKRVQG